MIGHSGPAVECQSFGKCMQLEDKTAFRKLRACPMPLLVLAPLLLCTHGCTSTNQRLDGRLAVEARKPPPPGTTNDQYLVQYPDVIEVTLEGPSPGSWRFPVGIDGRIDCGPPQCVRVEGQPVNRIARGLEECLPLPAG